MIGLLTQKSTASSTPLTLKKRPLPSLPPLTKKVAVIIRHREEWETQRALVTTAIEKNDFDKAKLAKITAETLKIRQEAERKAWGIRDVDAQPDGGALTVRILRVSGE
mgnify:CR=1 FL=1